MQELLKQLEGIKDQIKPIETGPLYNPKCQTVKITFEAPDDSRVDINQYSIAIQYNPEKKKFKFVFLLKDATAEFIKDMITVFEEMKTPVANRVLWINDNYDSFLLKNYQWFERYQTVDDTGSTTMRYLLRNLPAFIKNQEEQKRKEEEIQRKKEERKAQVIAEQQAKDAAAAEKQQSPLQEAKESSGAKFTFKIAPKPDYLSVKPKLVSVDEVISFEEWDRQNLEKKLAQARAEPERIAILPSIGAQPAIRHHTDRNKVDWSEENSRCYQALLKGLAPRSATREVLQLVHLFMLHSVDFPSISEEVVVLSFHYPFALLRDRVIKSEYLKILAEYVKAPDAKIKVLLNINLKKPDSSFIRLDPQADIVYQLTQFSRRLSQRPEMTHQDITDRSLLSFASRLLTQLLRYDTERSKAQAVVEGTHEISQVFGTAIIRPQCQRAAPEASELRDAQPTLLEESVAVEMIQQLPEPFSACPWSTVKVPQFFKFFTDVLPEMMPAILSRAAEQVFEERVQNYLENEGYKETSESSSESSNEIEGSAESGDEDYSYNSYDESSEESSIYEAYGLIKEEFLQPIEFNKNVICLKLAKFDLQGGLLVQFIKPVVSVICTQCLKMMPLTLEPNSIKNEYGNYVDTNLLTCTDQCQNCGAKMVLHLVSQIFNQFTQGECMFVQKQQSCLPVNMGYLSESAMLIQCSGCNSLGLQQGLKEHSSGGSYSCRCPMCFKRIVLSFEASYFLLPNGEQLPLPSGIKKQQQKKVIQHSGPLPNQGTCEHAKRSFRWFRFACGGSYPCDTCHDKACSCGDKYAKMMICGFCGKTQAVQDTCSGCKQYLLAKKTGHWEGGRGMRNATAMSRKDNKKYTGHMKTRSNKDKKRTAMQKRGNAKKKLGDEF